MSELRLRAAVVQDGAAIGALFLASRRDALQYLLACTPKTPPK